MEPSSGDTRPRTFRLSRLLVVMWLFWLLTLGSAQFLRHRIQNHSSIGLNRLDAIVPVTFGDWNMVSADSTPIVNPQLKESLQTTYDDTLNRTYVNRMTGQRVMLSLAYGRDQGHEKQVHKPEVCYPSQGFAINTVRKLTFRVAGHDVPVTTLHATKATRSEFVAYWIVEGDSIVRGALQQNFKRAWLALRGIQEDGLLFRVSMISEDEVSSKMAMHEFVDSMIKVEDPATRSKMIGAGSMAMHSTR